MPFGFDQAGWIDGIILLAVIGFLAYVSVTFVVENQSHANAILNITSADGASLLVNTESTESSEIYNLTRRVELGLCAELFLGKLGYRLFYVVLMIYLYGDLAIYAVTVPTSLQQVTGGWGIGGLYFSESDVYYIYLYIFALCIIPICFFDFQRTKYLQYFTLATRNLAFWTMIVLACIFIFQGNGAHLHQVPAFDVVQLPVLFGLSVYSFMCHHSLPSIIAPIKNKNRIIPLFAGDFVFIFTAYIALCLTAVFAFGNVQNSECGHTPGPACAIQSLYTKNFSSFNIRPIAIFLTLFPVFTLTTNFPLIAITLRNNLMQLIPYNPPWFRRYRKVAFTLLTAIPPITVAFITSKVEVLVSFTGGYAGVGIMFIFPSLLVFASRRETQTRFGTVDNRFSSPFSHPLWVWIIIGASAIALVLITLRFTIDIIHGQVP